jgi:HEAT repeat protein
MALSGEDAQRLERVEALAALGAGGLPQLLELLGDPSWAVRREVVSALASLGADAAGPLCRVLVTRRDDEARLAAAVDALVASSADVTDEVERLSTAEDPHVVCDAAQILGRRRTGRAVPLLTRLSEHPDDNVAVAAIEALGRIGGRDAIDSLLATVRSDNFFRTFPALDVLGRSGDPRAVAPLAALLESPFYGPEAARALGRTGQAAGVAPLVAQLHRATAAVLRAAALGLAELHDDQERRFSSGAAVERAVRSSPSPHAAVQRLAECVPGASPDEQRALCRVIAWTDVDEASAALMALLDLAPAEAADALRGVGHELDDRLLGAIRAGDSARRLLLLPLIAARPSALGEAVACLDDADPAVRTAAADVLARMGDAAAVPALFEHLGDADLGVAQAVVSAIQSLGSAETERLATVAARSPDPVVRRAALRIIAYFGFASGLASLREALAADDERLREAALAGLPYIEEPGALELLLAHATHTSARTRAATMRALGQVTSGGPAIRALRRGLGDPDPWVVYYACQSLGKLRDESSVETIVALVAHPSGQVRVAAVEALAHLRAPAAAAALRDAARSSDLDVRRAALVGLGLARLRDGVPILLEATRSPDRATRLIALSALAEHDAPEVLPALLASASDADEAVREAAISRIAEWRGPGGTHVLVGLLGNATTRDRALDALTLPAPGRIAGLLGALEGADGELAVRLVSALARMNRPEAREALATALEMSSPAPRRAAIEALAALGDARALEALSNAAAHDPDPDIRREAAAALPR